MHILILVAGALGAAAFWWYRLKMMNEAAGEVVDAFGRVRGAIRRKKIRRQNELSPLTAIDDPVVAAATLIASIMSDDVVLKPSRESALGKEIDTIASAGKLDETIVYAKWAAAQIDDAQVVIDKLAPMLATRLDEHEKHGLLDMVRRVAKTDAEPLPMLDARLRRLRQKLGLVVN
jgi:uncharacterized tellurite resistance protein B-like protein